MERLRNQAQSGTGTPRKGFANDHTFARYFHGAHTDYVGARRMVNGHDRAAAIAKLAADFETILIGAKAQTADTPDVHNP